MMRYRGIALVAFGAFISLGFAAESVGQKLIERAEEVADILEEDLINDLPRQQNVQRKVWEALSQTDNAFITTVLRNFLERIMGDRVGIATMRFFKPAPYPQQFHENLTQNEDPFLPGRIDRVWVKSLQGGFMKGGYALNDGFNDSSVTVYHTTVSVGEMTVQFIAETKKIELCTPTECIIAETAGGDDVGETTLPYALQPGLNRYVVRAYTDRMIYQQFVNVTYIDPARPVFDGAVWEATPSLGYYDDVWSCYENRYAGDEPVVTACEKNVQAKYTTTKEEACTMPDGKQTNFLALQRPSSEGYAQIRGWFKHNGALRYSVESSENQNISCESETFSTTLYTYDCAARKTQELGEIPSERLDNCGVTVQGVTNNVVVYTISPYEWHNGILENYRYYSFATKKNIPISFFMDPKDAAQLGREPQLSEESRKAIMENARSIFANTVVDPGEEGDFIAYSIKDITDTTMTLVWIVDFFRPDDGAGYDLIKEYHLKREGNVWNYIP